MPLSFQLSDKHYRLGIWKMDETEEQLLALLPHAENYRREVMRFQSASRRKEWLAVRALLFVLLQHECIVCYLPSGKPYLGGSTDTPLSISHTAGYAAVLIGNGDVKGAGVDIEAYSTRVRKVASRFMNTAEQVTSWRGDYLWSMLLHWSAKETMYKCMNAENVDFREHLHIKPFQPAPSGSFEAYESYTSGKQRFTIQYMLHSDFVLTWTVLNGR